ncbi:MAG: S8/S53 family peptidase [Thermoplasmatota archaeon]
MRWIALSFILLAFAGCLSDSDPDPTPGVDETPDGTEFQGRVVVAVIDSGVNVYHDFYQTGLSLTDEELAQLSNDGTPARRIQLTQTGAYPERVQADAEIWAGIQPGELVYFDGTNVLGISHNPDAHPVLDDGSHGTGTTTSVLNANPDALIVLVEGVGSSAGEQWAATTPWVDILSESYGLYCGQPVLELVPGDSTAKNNKIANSNGKLVVGAADNTPCPANNDGTAGPPWVVGVAGDHPGTESDCREPISGNFPDFTADFTQTLSSAGTINENRTMSGTSFATPTTAGVFSAVLQNVRTAWGHEGGITDGAMAIGPEGERFTQADLRDAVNRTARYFEFSLNCEEPVPPVAPWVSQGWGHVGPEIIPEATAQALGLESFQKDAQATQYMELQYTYRQTAWGLVI